MSTKLLAFYLPQFHTIPENDRWWGTGFTEWKRVKNAKPIFQGHHQPKEPIEYYDLSDENVMINQAQLAKQYGLYGFCYYHYWFNGKKLLEKPLKQMLVNRNIDIPFCLSWANEPWTRAWDGNKKEILMPQEYGGEKEWEEHLNYLLPFFKDERYIKINGKPLFVIYRTASFADFEKMIEFWNYKLHEKGLDELFLVETLNSFQKKPTCKSSKAVIEFEPMFTISSRYKIQIYLKKIKALFSTTYRTYNYDEVWRKILKRKTKYNNKVLFSGAFVDWDNTPRFKERAAVFVNGNPEKFQSYANELIVRKKPEFVFINAWNEWAEGAYLEPDKKNGLKYLEAISKISDTLNK